MKGKEEIKMNKRDYVILFVVIITLLFGGITLGFIIGRNTKKCEECPELTSTLETLYYSSKNRNVYLYGINSFKYNDKELNTYKDVFSTINKVIKGYKKTSEYDDGGSAMYKSENYNILVCNTISGNKDIYIGNKNMLYEDHFCKNIIDKDKLIGSLNESLKTVTYIKINKINRELDMYEEIMKITDEKEVNELTNFVIESEFNTNFNEPTREYKFDYMDKNDQIVLSIVYNPDTILKYQNERYSLMNENKVLKKYFD